MMKCYIGSCFSNKGLVADISEYLSGFAIETTVRWWEKDFKTAFGEISDAEWYAKPEVQEVYERNLQGIAHADIVVIISQKGDKLTGASVEIGYAIALNKPVFLVGELKRSAMYCQIIPCKNKSDLMCNIIRWQDETGYKSGGEKR